MPSALNIIGAIDCFLIGVCMGLGWWLINRLMNRIFG